MNKTIIFSLLGLMLVGLVSAGSNPVVIENFQSSYDKKANIVTISYDEVRDYSYPARYSQIVRNHKGEQLAIGEERNFPTFNRICIGTVCIPKWTPETCVSDEEYQIAYDNMKCYRRYNGEIFCPTRTLPFKCSEVIGTFHKEIELEMPKKSEIKGLGNLQASLNLWNWSSKEYFPILENRVQN